MEKGCADKKDTSYIADGMTSRRLETRWAFFRLHWNQSFASLSPSSAFFISFPCYFYFGVLARDLIF
jgi:hypothetical protein